VLTQMSAAVGERRGWPAIRDGGLSVGSHAFCAGLWCATAQARQYRGRNGERRWVTGPARGEDSQAHDGWGTDFHARQNRM